MHHLKRYSVLTFICLLVAGCGSFYVPEPIGIGSSVDELKLSPCACVEIPQYFDDWANDDWALAS